MPVLDHINNADEQPRERKDQERKHAEQHDGAERNVEVNGLFHDGFANICK
jgi:hypothetical protein